jgi:hypothetical protein
MRLYKLSSVFFILPLVASEYFEYVLQVKSPFNMKDTLVAHGKTETADTYEIEEMRPHEDLSWTLLSSCLNDDGKDWTDAELGEENMDCEKDRLWWGLSRLSFKGDFTHSRPYNVTEGDTTMMVSMRCREIPTVVLMAV